MTTPFNPALKQAGAGGARPNAKALSKKKVLLCDERHIRTLRREIRRNGLSLKCTTAKNQCQVLVQVLQYLGDRGLNTLEAVGLGYYRIATRVQELEAAGLAIFPLRESVLGSDGLLHVGIARYILRDGKVESAQLPLDLGAA